MLTSSRRRYYAGVVDSVATSYSSNSKGTDAIDDFPFGSRIIISDIKLVIGGKLIVHNGMHGLRLLNQTTKFSGVGCNPAGYVRTLNGCLVSNRFAVVIQIEGVVTYL